MFLSSSEVFQKMDDAGRKGEPFLFVLDFELREGLFVSHPHQQQEILFDINGITNAEALKEAPAEYKFERFPEPFEVYKKRFEPVMSAMESGKTSLLNLTIKTPIQTSLTMKEIFEYSTSKYRLLVPERFVCFSPERFVKVCDGKIYSHPMKGTIDANLPNAEATLMNDPKELAEHKTMAELTMNDLARVADNVQVNRFRYIDKVKTNHGYILQSSSEIEGTLPDKYLEEGLGSLFSQLLPAGSILGQPRKESLEVVKKAEQQPRGFYSGVVGYFDGTTLDSGVLIRFMEQDGGQLFFRSGGGITIDSDCKREYQEAIQKVYLPF